jgi:hypothetical protein
MYMYMIHPEQSHYSYLCTIASKPWLIEEKISLLTQSAVT